jgi:hypothetical protein
MDINVAYDKLTQFESADEIADFFTEYNVKAIPGEAKTCAIAKWIENETGESVYVFHMGIDTADNWKANTDPNKEFQYPLTDAMHSFIKKFDSEHYPQLLEGVES